MNLKQFEYVLTIYQEGNLTRAAAKLYITQPALSQQLSKLETEIGAPLFDRSTTPMKPTYVGQHYLNTIQKILFEHEQSLRWIEDLSLYKSGKLTIGMPIVRSLQFLPILLPEFKKRYPNIEITLIEAPALSLPLMVEKGEIDFAFIIAEADQTGLTFLPLMTEQTFLAVPAEFSVNQELKDSMKKLGTIDIRCCAHEPFILLKRGHRLHAIANRIFQEAEISPPVLLKTENVILSHQLTASGYGLSYVGEIAMHLANFDVPPQYYPLTGPNTVWKLGIAYHPNKYVTKAMEAFFVFTREMINDLPLLKKQAGG